VLVAALRPALLAASDFTDPKHERLIYVAAGGLVLLGIVLAAITVIWWRATKGEHAALAPLEVMGDRSWNKLTHVEQTRRIETVRTHDGGDVEPAHPVAEPVDLDEALRTFQPGFDDLRDAPAEDVVAAQPSSVAADETGEVEREVVAAPDESPTEASDDGAAIVQPMLDGEPVEG
jgi:hypothetical protein